MSYPFQNNQDPFKVRGHLTISKRYTDGREEECFSAKNIVVRGMGYSVASLMANVGATRISDFQIDYFQVGTSFVGHSFYPYPNNVVFFSLADPLDQVADYGRNIRTKVDTHNVLTTSSTFIEAYSLYKESGKVFAELPKYRTTRLNDNTIKYKIIVENNMANGNALSEIGLFIKNPDGDIRKNTSILAAYKNFPPINKTSDFSIIFDWAIQITDVSSEITEIPQATTPFFTYNQGESAGDAFTSYLGENTTITLGSKLNIQEGSFGIYARGAAVPVGILCDAAGTLTLSPIVSAVAQTFLVSAIPTDTANYGSLYYKTFYVNQLEDHDYSPSFSYLYGDSSGNPFFVEYGSTEEFSILTEQNIEADSYGLDPSLTPPGGISVSSNGTITITPTGVGSGLTFNVSSVPTVSSLYGSYHTQTLHANFTDPVVPPPAFSYASGHSLDTQIYLFSGTVTAFSIVTSANIVANTFGIDTSYPTISAITVAVNGDMSISANRVLAPSSFYVSTTPTDTATYGTRYSRRIYVEYATVPAFPPAFSHEATSFQVVTNTVSSYPLITSSNLTSNTFGLDTNVLNASEVSVAVGGNITFSPTNSALGLIFTVSARPTDTTNYGTIFTNSYNIDYLPDPTTNIGEPQFSYMDGDSALDPFNLLVGSTSSYALFTSANIVENSFGIDSSITDAALQATCLPNGYLSFNPTTSGSYFVGVSCVPLNPSYGFSYTREMYCYVTQNSVPGSTLASSFLTRLAWLVPQGYSIGNYVVVNAIVPVTSADLSGAASSVMLLETSTVCQKNIVTRNSVGEHNTIEVTFSATVSSNPGNYQTFNIWSTSSPDPSSQKVDIPSWFSSLVFSMRASNGELYRGNFLTSTNTAMVSSIVKQGPYSTTYRHFARLLRQGSGGNPRPYLAGVHAYITCRKNDPAISLDFRISNGHIACSSEELAGLTYSGPLNANKVVGDIWFSSLELTLPVSTSATLNLDRWSTYKSGTTVTTSSTWNIVDPYPIGSTYTHVFPRCKAIQRRMVVFPTASALSNTKAKDIALHNTQAFCIPATVGSKVGNTFYNTRAYGHVREIIPKINNNWTAPQDYFWGENTNTEGVLGQNIMVNNIWLQFVDKVGRGQRDSQRMGLASFPGFNEHQSKKVFWFPYGQDGAGDGSLDLIAIHEGFRQLNSELRRLQAITDTCVERSPYWLTNVSGNPTTQHDVVNAFGGGGTTSNRRIRYQESGAAQAGFHFPEFLNASPNISPAGYNNYYNSDVNPFSTGGYSAGLPFDGAHQTRARIPLYAYVANTNDAMAKETLFMDAEVVAISKPQYIPGSVGGNFNSFLLSNGTTVNSTLATSGRGLSIATHRWDAWDNHAMIGAYQFADNTWRTRNQKWFNLCASSFMNSWMRESGLLQAVYPDNFSPHPNDIQMGLTAGHWFSATPQIGDGGKIPWYNSGRVTSESHSNPAHAVGHGVIPNEVLIFQSLEVGYMTNALWALYRSVFEHHPTVKAHICSSVYLTASSLLTPPGLHVPSAGNFNDSSWSNLSLPIDAVRFCAANGQNPYYLYSTFSPYAAYTTQGKNYIGGRYFGGIRPNPSTDTRKALTLAESVASGYYSHRIRNDDLENMFILGALASSLDNPSAINSSNQLLKYAAWWGHSAYELPTLQAMTPAQLMETAKLNSLSKCRHSSTFTNGNYGSWDAVLLAYINKIQGIQ